MAGLGIITMERMHMVIHMFTYMIRMAVCLNQMMMTAAPAAITVPEQETVGIV
jgi:hypothetical protein